MRWGVLHAEVIPDELFQIREIEGEVIVEGATACDTDG
jgi:hypothetical protein